MASINQGTSDIAQAVRLLGTTDCSQAETPSAQSTAVLAPAALPADPAAAYLTVAHMQIFNTADANGVMPSDHNPVLAVFQVK